MSNFEGTTVLNLTQHRATKEQINQGVIDLNSEGFVYLGKLLTFESMPTRDQITYRASEIAMWVTADNYQGTVMIGGAPFLMPFLFTELEEQGCHVVFAFSERVSSESTDEAGNVIKTNVFKHVGFV